MTTFRPVSEGFAKGKAESIKLAVATFNKAARKKLEFVGEEFFRVGQQCIYSAQYRFGDRVLNFCGCRSLPNLVIEEFVDGKKPGDPEFMDEFMETLA